MKEYEELFNKFSKLGLDEKRNAFNEETNLFEQVPENTKEQ